MHIQVKNVHFHYSDTITALNSLSFTVAPGECLALVGHNGCGKTTLVKHLNGLLHPSSGIVCIGDWLTHTKTVPQLSHRVALLFQNPDDQISKRQVWDEVAFGPRNLKFSEAKIKDLVDESLQLVELTEFKDHNPYDLGYSQRKRVAIASIVAMDTPIIIFDEPTAGLDPSEMRIFHKVLQFLREKNRTTLIITHDMDFIAEQIPRVIALQEGEKEFDGTTRRLFQRDDILEKCGLRTPQIARLSTYFRQNGALTPEEFISSWGSTH